MYVRMYTLTTLHTLLHVHAHPNIQSHLFQTDPPTQIEVWISEKMQVATDESYRDPTNLEGKLQKHQKFEAEITPNEQRIHAIAQVGLTVTTHGTFVFP